MKRRNEIAAELRRLRTASHPGEFFEEIERVYMARPRVEKPPAQPGDPLPVEEKAWALAAWKESGQGRDKWAQQNCGDDPQDRRWQALKKRVERASKVYENDPDFRELVDFYRWALGQVRRDRTE